MTYNKEITVIIPHRNSLSFLPKLFSTIPKDERLEIILVDNSPKPISKDDIGIDREYTLIFSSPERGAGGARNEGVKNAKGKWLVFADADDFFTENAFDSFFSHIDSSHDVIYFGMNGVYVDTGEYSDRGDQYTNMVKQYLSGQLEEEYLRYFFASPCSKMVKQSLVTEHNILFDEVKANNDDYFALMVGYYAKSIGADDKVVYTATVSRGSISNKRDAGSIQSRYGVLLRINSFLKKHNLNQYQRSVANCLLQALRVSPRLFFHFIFQAIKNKQNLFIG